MRTPVIAGNWKMHKTVEESVSFVHALAPALAMFTGIECVVAPSFVALVSVANALQGTNIKVSAQQVHWEEKGAFTSQIAPTMLKGIAEYVIIGHSECRQYLNETDTTVNRKLKACLAHGLTPIVAVGESDDIRSSGTADSFVRAQVIAAFDAVSAEDAAKTVVAYEPIWAIGTGKNATSQIAQDMIGGTIRGVLRELYGETTASLVRIQYGGSVKPDNMLEYMSQPDIDGALVGGASLDVESFKTLVALAAQAKGV
jgi:triosephosphate isomerase